MTALRTKVMYALTSNKISEKDIVTNEQLSTSVVVPPIKVLKVNKIWQYNQ